MSKFAKSLEKVQAKIKTTKELLVNLKAEEKELKASIKAEKQTKAAK